MQLNSKNMTLSNVVLTEIGVPIYTDEHQNNAVVDIHDIR